MTSKRRLALALVLGSMLALALVSVALATHARPGGGFVLRVPLVPAFNQCTTLNANSTHVAPIALPSCTPPVLTSDILTLGTTGQGQGSIKLTVFCVAPETTPPCTANDGQEEQDISIALSQTDVRCQKVTAGCSAVGADYTGRLIGQSLIRITDHANGTPVGVACTNGGGTSPCVTATVQDTTFAVPTPVGSCVATGGTAGATCTFNSTINAQVPGAVKEFQRGDISIFGLQVTDVGEDGNPGAACPPVCGTGDETRFADQGLFIP